ncbi:hypothetical protein ACFPN2_28855 [Steroidobacter flavus]|uniref:VCBS repeat-containing protein n=1 Tax=Steroidobacter flavus TaxID=1842136 RepID=A0ABV8SZR0_9GAMM
MEQSSELGSSANEVTALGADQQTIRKKWTALGGFIAAVLVPVGGAQAQTIPPQYQYALQRAEYLVSSGDVNGDGTLDVLVKARVSITFVDIDLLVPIVLKPASPTFVLLSSGGTYTLSANPDATLINHPAWQASSHDLVFGDVLGTGNNAMLLRGRANGSPNFVIVTSSSTGAPVLSQQLSAANLGVDISGSTHSVSLVDTNRDGRADLVLRTNGTIDTVFAASADGLFAAPQDEEDRVMMAWRAFCAALDAGDLASAQQFISPVTQARYMTGLTNLGPAVTTFTSTLAQPREVSTTATFAEYAITQTYNGSTYLHLIVFRKSSNRWQLEEF